MKDCGVYVDVGELDIIVRMIVCPILFGSGQIAHTSTLPRQLRKTTSLSQYPTEMDDNAL
jgi:hypothetical protein